MQKKIYDFVFLLISCYSIWHKFCPFGISRPTIDTRAYQSKSRLDMVLNSAFQVFELSIYHITTRGIGKQTYKSDKSIIQPIHQTIHQDTALHYTCFENAAPGS